MSKYNVPQLSKDRAENDYYATKESTIQVLLEKEKFKDMIFEPCVGGGHIARVLENNGYKVKGQDLVYRGYGDNTSKDFLQEKYNDLDIITNPPFNLGLEFLEHAMNISADGTKIAMLFRLAFLETQKRYEFFKKHPPKKVYVFVNRISFLKNGEQEKVEKKQLCFAWFIFEKGYQGKTELDWIGYK